MEILLIKDSRGKDLLVFSKENINEYDEMGDKVDDFEILQVIGEGSFGFVAKVKSRLNHKIYAMKQINFSSIKDKKIIFLCENEIKILSKIKHPLISKYYKHIKDGEFLYIIMEFMNNGDLGGLLKAHKTLEKPIPEEKIYDIFIQSMKSLAFIHSKKLIHRDIKPENLFISVDGTVKLGDFGVSASIVINNEKNKNLQYLDDYKKNKDKIKDSFLGEITCNQTMVGTPPFMSPEMLLELQYDLKTDIYSMGVTFFELCFWHLPRVPKISEDAEIELVDIPIKNNQDFYSQELIDIIYKMIEKDKNKRPDAETVLNLLQYEFNKKYSKNSSIGSILCCLYSFEELTEYLKRPNNQDFINKNSFKMPISFAYLYGIKSINESINEDWNNSICKIRSVLTSENNIYSGNKEIEIKHILYYLIGKMHRELNQKKSNDYIKRGSSGVIEYENKNKALTEFLSFSKNNNQSPIYDFFYGLMKTKTVCQGCDKSNRKYSNYSFNYFYYISFDINLAQKKNQNLSIKDLFNIQNNIKIKISKNKFRYCQKCNSVQVHYQRKQFYSFPPFLIICFDRGNNCQNKTKIKYDLNLNLEKQFEFNGSPKNYRLIGIVKRLDKNEKEHYISLYFDYKNNSWILRDDSSITYINSPMEHSEGIEMILFFKNIKNENNNINKNFNKKPSSGSIDDFYD